MSIWLPLLLSLIASFADVIGGAIVVFKRFNKQQLMIITAMGSGFLLGATFLDRLPDSMSQLPDSAALYIMIGYIFMLVLERFGFSHHHVAHEKHDHTLDSSTLTNSEQTPLNQQTGLIAFLGMLVHTFMDGVIIAGAFSISKSTGLLIFIAITFHKLPEGMSMATVSLASGSSRRKAFGTSIGLAISTMLGASVTLWLGNVDSGLIKIIMALATGTFIFITTTDLIPAVRQSKSSKAILAVIMSVVLFYVSLLFIKHLGLK